ncbi:MAG: apolipoprotein N-acyltransferase [Thiogranum sp.]|nr:apolipoprotein N-acyltransferase [Thiogranum sp.]
MLTTRAGKALAALLAGALLPLGFAPFGLFPLPLLALAVLASLLYRAPPRNAFLYAWLFGVGQFGVGVSWIYISIYLYGDASLAVSVAVMLLFVAILAVYFALAAAALARAGIHSAGWFLLAGFPAAWVFTEWVRSWLFTGFPWLNLGYSQIDGPLAGYAAVSGVYGVGWLAALSAGLLAWMLYAGRSARLQGTAALLLVWSAGFALQHHDWTEVAGAPFTATLVQGNISQDLKWRSDQQQSTLKTYVTLTRQHLDSDLVVWPETAVPAYYDSVDMEFLEPLRRELQQHEVSLLTGVPVLERSSREFFNAVISLEQPGHFYFKEHLVPFGEYLPLRNWLAQVLSFLPVPEGDFSAGPPRQLPLIAAGHPVGASICYEIAFGEQLIRSVPSAAYLVNVSNDAWFGDSLAPHQHLEMARMRARETGRYVLRATNTGVSAIIDADGGLLNRSELFETQTVTAAVEPRSGITPYVRWGNWPVVTGLVAVLLVAGIRGRKL